MLFRSACEVFFFTNLSSTETYTLSLHDALPISIGSPEIVRLTESLFSNTSVAFVTVTCKWRSEEHTTELQSQSNVVCGLMLANTMVDDSVVAGDEVFDSGPLGPVAVSVVVADSV